MNRFGMKYGFNYRSAHVKQALIRENATGTKRATNEKNPPFH